jgi:CDP-diacylglycerol--serine O-phosphatidyltransferase|tara:strand:+ start:353 stop:1102 length:750 start_codon:yes stop_codon:yes gene_type:complete
VNIPLKSKFVRSIPNLLTFASVGCGFTTLAQLLEQNYTAAMIWMCLAVLFDGLDGKAANLLGVKTESGPILDSLSDVISFAFLPGFSLYLFFSTAPETQVLTSAAAWVVGIGYTLGGLMRLVRFTVSQSDRDRGEGFVGLPSPPPAGLIIAFVSLAGQFPEALYHLTGLLFFCLIIGVNVYLMTFSNIVYWRWGALWIALQTGSSLVFAAIAYYYLGTIGAFLAIFYIAFCGIYIYSHIALAILQKFRQ